MKTLQKYFSLLLVMSGLISPAFAQRGDHHGGDHSLSSGNRQSFSSSQRSSEFRPGNSFANRQDRQTNFSQPRQSFQNLNRDNRGNTNSFSSRIRSQNNNNSFIQRDNRLRYQQRPASVDNSFRDNSIARSDYRHRSYYGSRGYYNQRDYSHYGYGRYGYGRYGYGPRRYEYGGYRHYSYLPRTFISISFGGYPYYYDNGLFYSYYNGFYEPVYAPFGICIRTLPFGYYPFYWRGIPYYYYDGIYYRDHGDNEYEVVDAPIGAIVSTLPKGAKAVTVNGEKFYEFNGNYYKEGTNDKNEVVYTVVGKNGEINNSDDPNLDNTNPPLQIGDIISKLPENSRQVTINGQVLYVSPDNFYFKERTDNGAISYEVVGSDDPNTK